MNSVRHHPFTLVGALLDATRFACAAVLLSLACAVVRAGFDGAREIGLHHYSELGFTRSCFLQVVDSARAALQGGLRWSAALAVVVSVPTLLMSYFCGPLRDPRSAESALRSHGFVAWSSAVLLAAALGGWIVTRAQSQWSGSRDIAFVLLFALGWTVLLAGLARRVRTMSGPGGAAFAQSALAAVAVALIPSNRFGSALAHRFDDHGAAWGLVVTAAAAALVFAWCLRRATRVPSGRLPFWSAPLAATSIVSIGVILAVYGLPKLEPWLGRPTLAAARPHNVLLLAVDTVRLDATSIFGPNARGRDTTPNLRRLAERGVAFEQAISQAPWTLPAFASILTGRYPQEHGAYTITGRVAERETMLAEVLREAGYTTFAAISQYYLRAGSGFDQGCDDYDTTAMTRVDELGADRASTAALRMLARTGERPFFGFVHYYDPHANYLDHPGWTWADGYRGWLREQAEIENLVRNRHLLDEADLRYVVDLFDEEIASTDREIGRVLDHLDARDLWKDTLVILVVDHGEQFMEHGGFEHTTNVFEELVHVPLIVVPPGSTQATRCSSVVETRSVFGTVLDELEVDFGAEARTRSLLRTARAPADANARAFTITWPTDAEPSWGVRSFVSGMRGDRWKAIHDWTRDRRTLFDLAADPGERKDVSNTFPEVATEWSAELERWTKSQIEDNRGPAPSSIDAQGAEMLRSLGYMGDGR